MLATKEQLAAREREAKKARADADASRQVVRVQAEEALALAGQLQAVERLGAEHEEALARARAVADEARQAQDEVEAAWAEASGRRPVTFVEYIELRREVQQLALAGREFFVSPDSGRQQGVFLTRLARLETMLSGARHEGKALERTAGSAVALSDFTSKPLIARAVTQALHVDAAQPLHLPPGPANFGRRNSLPAPGSPSAGTVGSHLQTMQGLRSMHSLSSAGSQRRQGLPPSRPPSGRIR
ncbi:hypothetical protein T492DRAFT_1093221 [Pavlovales sp. CCMP2436]|nr:hypothetical protein T492DRAFT_1093221 [Pavlovales sp. CCMP2436]